MNEVFREVAELLYGGGVEFSKMNPEGADLSARRAQRKKVERRQAQIGYASNVVGLAAGVAGTRDAYQTWARTHKSPKGKRILTSGKKISGKTKALAGGALALQVANVAGDTVANRVLARSAKKDPNVKGGTATTVRVARQKLEPVVTEQTKKISKGALVPVSKKVEDSMPCLPETATAAKTKGKLTRAREITPVDPVVGRGKLIPTGKGKSKFLPEGPEGTRERGKKQIKKSDEFDVTWEAEISKVNADKQQVFGWASIVEINGEPVVDLQGDYIAIDEVEKSAYEYVHKSRRGGDMHLRDGDQPVVKSHMIESFVVTPEKKEALGLPDEMPTGWWVGYQVNDPELWALVKDGKRTGFSIHGRGVRTPA